MGLGTDASIEAYAKQASDCIVEEIVILEGFGRVCVTGEIMDEVVLLERY